MLRRLRFRNSGPAPEFWESKRLTQKFLEKFEEKWNILVEMALIMKPELYNKYPLLQLPNHKIR